MTKKRSKNKKEENKIEHGSLINAKNNCLNRKKEIFSKDNFCSHCGKVNTRQDKQNLTSKRKNKSLVKIQKTTSGRYLAIWQLDREETNGNTKFEKGETCPSAENMPNFLTEHQEC